MHDHDQPRLGHWATWGLVAAWAIHDLEELATMASWGRRTARRLARSRPGTLAWVLDNLDRSQSEVAVAIGLVGTAMGAAAALGAATNGRHRVYQAAVAGFGLHGLTHIAQSVSWGGYTPGVVTAPLVVIPYAMAVRHAMASTDHPLDDRRASGDAAVAFVPLAIGCHLAARTILRHRPAALRGET